MNNYRNYCEIDLNAVSHNVSQIRKIIGNNTKIMGIVKADAYGHGAIKIAERLINEEIDFLGVATIEEALEIRNHFSDVSILVLGFIPYNQISTAINNSITLSAYNLQVANDISECAQRLEKIAKVHIKLDTGMNRIGFWGSQIKEIYKLKDLKCLEIEGIYTHFSCADCDPEYTEKQFSRFIIVCDKLQQYGFDIKYKHCCNSSGIINFPKMHLDIVRPGIMIYGLLPHEGIEKSQIDLKPVMSLKTQITHIKKVPKLSKISYGGTFLLDRESVIATIPIGYADGYSRRLSNNINVIVNGKLSPVLGRICMDVCMIDVTEIEDVKLMDEVVIMGDQGGNKVTADDLANKTGTINYEVIASIGKRVPRIYKE